ncbi:U1 small nuclear ribonucleoprotein C [Sporothrix eucalyptigena]|uniref:U1 small nuclear ribonucleoprotein C n=1 Tax=Sporothrix eucalyptigena TaxID=1812306 RepID=A0ABP0BUQ5_9PEZI
MPKFFCDYCDVYLTHDSMSVRKAHNSGRNHLRNVVDYYQRESSLATTAMQRAAAVYTLPSGGVGKPHRRYGHRSNWRRPRPEIGHEKAQSVIDSITSSYAAEGQAHANPMLPHNQPGYAAAQARFGGGRPAFPNSGGLPGGPRGMGGPNGIPSFSSGPPGASGAPGAPGAPGVGGGLGNLPMPPQFNFPGGLPPPGSLPPPPGSAAFGGAPGAPGAPGAAGGARGFQIPPPPMFGANGAPGANSNMPPFPFPIPLPGQPGAPPPGANGLPNFPGFPAGMPIPVPGQNGFPPIPPPNFMQGGGAGGPPMQGPPGNDRR